MDPRRKRWLGGYVRTGKRGPVFVIERFRGGDKFHVSTKCRTERAALKELERWELDPWNYEPGGSAPVNAVRITAELILEYRRWMIDEKGNMSEEWATDQARLLRHWLEDLAGKDLRAVTLTDDLEPALARRKTSRRHRVEAIKGFCRWLWKRKGVLKRRDDPTAELLAPPVLPAKLRRKRVVDMDRLRAVVAELPDLVRDVLILQSGTAWHVSEVRRFAVEGEILPPIGGSGLAVLSVLHKKRKRHNTPIHHAEHLDAAKRIRARGKLPSRKTLAEYVRAACDKLELKGAARFYLGDIRHTVLTNAVLAGASPEQASEFAGHESVVTTKKFYLDLGVPTVSVPVLRVLEGGGAEPPAQAKVGESKGG